MTFVNEFSATSQCLTQHRLSKISFSTKCSVSIFGAPAVANWLIIGVRVYRKFLRLYF